jgi:elongation factor Ts
MSTDEVKKLREETGQGIMECRKAIEQAAGDYDEAKLILEKNIGKIASKKSERVVKAGLVETYSHGGKIGVIVEVLCESDFVARNQGFKDLVHEIALQVASMNPEDVAELMDEPHIRDESRKISDLVKEKISKFGENIKINRFYRIELGRE